MTAALDLRLGSKGVLLPPPARRSSSRSTPPSCIFLTARPVAPSSWSSRSTRLRESPALALGDRGRDHASTPYSCMLKRAIGPRSGLCAVDRSRYERGYRTERNSADLSSSQRAWCLGSVGHRFSSEHRSHRFPSKALLRPGIAPPSKAALSIAKRNCFSSKAALGTGSGILPGLHHDQI